ncbi:hypothetical protein SEA_MOLLYMUR_46 [Gordonia phage Mollymur]|uniref:Uncharacterized protein n=1 Tax=Gordonia phage Mollymur TaxID=2590895 RepID=A0A4Y6EAG2_9CAUD|nr:hypothetical protein PQB84_gp079 [Gordonia phage Mollymur]QDF15407.1 hypothetical protein SEA_MOLLYMUR_46 [Gordonia phage Mollymur]
MISPPGPITQIFTEDEKRRLGRCQLCEWHLRTQGHHPHCPSRTQKKGGRRQWPSSKS